MLCQECKDSCGEGLTGTRALHKSKNVAGSGAEGGHKLAVWCINAERCGEAEGPGPGGPCWKWEEFGFHSQCSGKNAFGISEQRIT